MREYACFAPAGFADGYPALVLLGVYRCWNGLQARRKAAREHHVAKVASVPLRFVGYLFDDDVTGD